MLEIAAVLTILLDITPMIKTNIWVFWSLYIIYALISVPLFLSTSGGWLALFFYLIFTSFYYIASSILLFCSAAFRTRRKRTKIKINGSFLLKIIASQVFVVLFNYNSCGDGICYEGFLPSVLSEVNINIPIFFEPPFVVLVFALILYLIMLSLFLLDIA
jgi:hypothetical protein